MKTSHTLLASAALTLAALSPLPAQAAGALLLNENFNNVASLSGWLQVNHSTGPGESWFQGNPGVFGSQSGPADAYIGANYLSALNGLGMVDNWLITPELSFGALAAQLSFYTRSQSVMGMNDTLEVRYSAGAGTDTSGFTTLLATIGGAAAYPSAWQQFTASLTPGASGRFAFRYVGDAASSNFIGIDTVSVTAVPEPASCLMFGLGLAALALLRRTPGQPSRPLKGARHVQQ